MAKMTDQIIDKMNEESRTIVLGPADIWLPQGDMRIEGVTKAAPEESEKPKEDPLAKTLTPETCGVHIWQDVVLFTHTVTECKKCGKIRKDL